MCLYEHVHMYVCNYCVCACMFSAGCVSVHVNLWMCVIWMLYVCV